jgi:hypothetical protein
MTTTEWLKEILVTLNWINFLENSAQEVKDVLG